MNLFEARRHLADMTVRDNVGTLPGHGDRVPIVKLPQIRVRALAPAFYVNGRVAEEGGIYVIDIVAGKDLVARGLAELVV